LKKDTLWRSIISLLLGFCTVILVQFVVTLLPDDPFRAFLTGLVAVPASFIAGIFFPEGKPAGGDNVTWELIITMSKIALCAFIWFAVLAWRNRRSQSAVM
jgi:hypothetical protein